MRTEQAFPLKGVWKRRVWSYFGANVCAHCVSTIFLRTACIMCCPADSDWLVYKKYFDVTFPEVWKGFMNFSLPVVF